MATSRYFSGKDNHAAVVFDAISEGEIEGLVKGDSSIYFDDVPLRDGVTESKVGSFATYATTNTSTAVVTLLDGALDNVDTTGNPKRLITIKGAGVQGASSDPDITFSTTEGDHTITASAAFFTSSMVKSTRQTNGTGLLRIVGAGFEGRDLLTLITQVAANGLTAEVDVAPVNTVSGKAGGIDLVSTIISYDPSNNQVTISDQPATAMTGNALTGVGYTIIGPANTSAINTNTSGIKRNFDSVQYEFRSGTKHQSITKLIAANPPSASFVYPPNQRMNQTQISGVTGTGTNSAFTYAASAIGATEPAETDAVGWTIEIPSLIARSTKSGNEHNSWVEITVDFEYTRDGTNYTSERILGRTDTALAAATIHDFDDNTMGNTHGYIINQTTKPIIEQYEFSIQPYKPFTNWRLKFQRVNEPNKTLGHHEHTNEAIIKYLEAHITDKLTYPYTAYAALSFSAKDFSSPPKRGYHIRGKKIQVPTNYKTREEMSSNSATYKRNVATGALETTYQDWDGNFRGDVSTFSATDSNPANYNLVYCNNPAWVYYDIVRDPRYGLGHIVEASLVDKYSLYQIARYCDELVPDGKGGQEPRFTCNVYITKAQEAYKVLKDLASVFRAMTFWMDGQLVAVQDRPREPIYTFSQGNVINGEFSYESTSERIRANQYLVTWMDPEDNYKSKVEIVDDVDNIIEKGRIVSKDFKAFGCTSQGQANRIGKWAITTDKLENEICKFSTGINAGFLRPGDIVNIQDATIDAIQFSGRIKAGTNTQTVTLDRAITLASGTTYKLHLIYPEGGAYLLSPEKAHINSTTYKKGDLVLLDESGASINTFAKATNVKEDSDAASNGGTENSGKVDLTWSENSRVETKTINLSAGTVAAGGNVTVSSAFSSTPNSEVIWAISGSNSTSSVEVTGIPVEYRIMGIEDEGEGIFNILAALYKSEKYDIVEKGYTLEPTRESVLNKPVSIHRDAFFSGPSSLTFNLKTIAASSNTSDSTEDLTGSLEAAINWSTPLETWIADNVLNATFVNEDLDKSETTITVGDASSLSATGYGVIEAGTSQEEIVYWSAKSGNNLTVTRGVLRSTAQAHDTGVSFEERRSYERVPPGLTNYRISHNFGIVSAKDSHAIELVSGNIHSYKVPNVTAGTYTVRIKAVYEGGESEWTVLEKTLTAPVTGQSQSLERLTFGGTISSGIEMTNSGQYNISTSPYTVVNTSGTEYNITQATASHAQRRQLFSSLTDGQTGYALFDASAYASDPWRAIIQVTDTTYHKGQTGIAGSFTWWQDVGASANGLTQASGTITTTLDSDTITGSSTAFTTDFAAGDFIRLHDSASTSFGTGSWYGYVDQVVSNTELKVVGTVTKAFTTKYAYKGTFRPDFINDFILSKVKRNSSSSYSADHYVIFGKVGANNVTSTEIITGGVDTANIAADAITEAKIEANAITNASILAGTIGALQIASNSIDTAEIVSGSIDTAHIAAGQITFAKMAANAIQAAQIVGGTITQAEIAANTISAANILANSITSAQISAANGPSVSLTANSVTSVHIATNQIGTSEIASNSVTAVSILANTVAGTQIAANSVNAVIVAQNAVTGVQIQTNAVVTEAIASNSVTSASVATNSIGAIAIVAGSITTSEIAADTISAANIATDAIGSSEVSSNAIGAVNISTNSIGAEAIATNSIAALNIVSGSITGVEIASNAIDTAEIKSGSIDALHISSGAITTAKIGADQITNATIATGAVDSGEIANGAIDTAHIGAGQITTAKIAANAIDTAEIKSGSIDALHISSGAITTAKIGADQITTATINAGAIGNTELGSDAVDSGNIADGAIDTAHIAAGQITTAKIAALNITTGLIAANAITEAKIEANTITNASILAGTIGTAQIAADAISSAKIAANAIDTAAIESDSIGTLHISAGSVTNAKISDMSIGKLTAGTLTVAQTVGSGAKILIDGANNRIVISD